MTVVALTVASCGGSDDLGAGALPVISGFDAAAVATTTAPSSPPPTTARPTTPRPSTVQPGAGSDGPGDAPLPSAPVPSLALDIAPLPNPLDDAGRRDPAAVARQWAGLKVLTSGMADGPLWPYSVAANLPELSDPTGQYVPNGRLHQVESEDLVVDGDRAYVHVWLDVADPAGATSSLAWDIELWQVDDSDIWLVAAARLAG